jgi:hypothetical protein
LLTFSFARVAKAIAEETSQTLQGPPPPNETINLPSKLKDRQNQTKQQSIQNNKIYPYLLSFLNFFFFFL